MAYQINLTGVSTSGTFTVKKDDTEGPAKLTTADSVVSANKTVATLNYDSANTSYVYADASAVSISGGANQVWNITGSAKDDTIDGSAFKEGSYIDAGDGADVITGAKSITINAGAGNDTITAAALDTVTAGDGNDVISVVGTEVVVDAGAGDDVISIGGASATVDGGDGKDSIAVAEKDATLTLGAGKDTVTIASGATGITITDYAFGEDTIKLAGVTYESLTSAGKISGTGADVTINSTNGYYAADIASASDGTAAHYAWASDTASTIDMSSQKEAVTIVGTTNGEGDILIGSAKNDTIYAGSGDSVVGGKGDDEINIAAKATGVVIGLYNQSGTDKVSGFEGGFEDDDDTIYVDSTATKFEIDTITSGLAFKAKGSTIKATGTSLEAKSGTAAYVKVNAGGTAYNAEVIKGEAALNEDATYIYGVDEKTTLDLTGSDDYSIDLSGNKGYGDTRSYYQITTVDASAGTGDYVLAGDGSTANTLKAGKSTTSLYGGGSSKDLLVGNKEGEDTFYYGSGDGKDSISNYTAFDSDGDAQDVINFYSGNITKVKATASGVTVTLDNSTANKLTIEGSITASSAMKVNYTTNGTDTVTAAIGLSTTSNTFTYDENVKQYIGSTKGDTLKVTNDTDANIWLDGYTGVTYSNVKLVDASSSTGDVVIAGTSANETLKGSKGSASLFGGFGSSNDVLVGNSQAETTFYFGKGDGKDTITTSTSTDRVMLYDVALSDVKSADLNSAGAMVVTLNDGSSLTVQHATSAVNTYQLTDGTFVYNASTKTWAQA